MKSRLEEDLRIGDLEGLIMDKFQVDSFQPKFCDEKDVAVLSFRVTQRESALKLSGYIARGPFNFLNVEASSSPDESGSYVVLAELDRSPEMFSTIEQLLNYIDQQVHVHHWQFKPYAADSHIDWNRDNFTRLVPQNPHEFLHGKSAAAVDAGSAVRRDASVSAGIHTGGQPAKEGEHSFNYDMLSRIVEKEISNSSRSYFIEMQKQFRKVTKDNRRLLQQFREIKTDHQQLLQQLDLFQRREKLALLREQQDIKRIQDLEDRLTYLLYPGPEKRGIPMADASAPTITIEPAEATDDGSTTEEFVDTEAAGADWTPGGGQSHTDGYAPGDMPVEEAEIMQPGTDAAQRSGEAYEAPTDLPPTEAESVRPAEPTADGEVESVPAADETLAAVDDSPAGNFYRQAMEASKRKEYPRAIEYFTRIIEISPNEPRAFYNLAILHYRLAEYEQASLCAKKAIDLGADGARKILDRVEAKKAAKTKRESTTTEPVGAEEDGSVSVDRPQTPGRYVEPPRKSPDKPYSDMESATVEIDGPIFEESVPAESETGKGDGYRTDVQAADTETMIVDGLPDFATPGEDDTVDTDVKTLGVTPEGADDDAVIESTDQQDSLPKEEPLVEQVAAKTTEDESASTGSPSAELDDFIQPEPEEKETLDATEPVTAPPVEKTPADKASTEEIEALEAFIGADTGGKTSVEKASAAKPPVEEPAVSEAFAEPAPAEEKPVEEPAVLEAFGEPAPVEEKPVEESAELESFFEPAPVEEKPVEESAELESFFEPAPVEEKPVEEAVELESLVEPTPAKEKLVEEPAVLEASVEQAPVEEATGDWTAVLDEFVEQTPAKETTGEEPPSVPEKQPAESDTPSEVVEIDHFTRGLAASKEKNYPEALKHFTKFVEQNPEQPRGYYNLAILNYRLKDFQTARDMARKALDMGVGSAQKVFEKSQLRIAKQRSISLDTGETASTETIFEELDTASFETFNPPSLEDFIETEKTDRPSADDHAADAVPEFPVLTGELDQGSGRAEGEAGKPAPADDLPKVEAGPSAEPATKPTSPAAVSDAPKPTAKDPTGQQPVEQAKAAKAEQTTAGQPPADAPKDGPAPAEDSQLTTAELDPEGIADDLFADGLEAYANKEFDKALGIFERFIDLRPREPRGYYNLSIVQYRRKDYSAAKANAEKALNLGARAAKKILLKIKKKKQKLDAPSADKSQAAGKPKPKPKPKGKRQATRRSKRSAAASPGKSAKPAKQTKSARSAAAPKGSPPKSKKQAKPKRPAAESTPTLESPERAAGGADLGDISDYDTATFDIAEVLGKDPVVWDADDFEEEVDTSNSQPPLIGGQNNDDVIVFDSTAVAASDKPPLLAPSAKESAAAGRTAKKDGTRSASSKKAAAAGGKGDDGAGSEVFSLGLAASEKKEYLKAIRYFKKFTEISPRDPRGYYNLAVVSYRLKSYETAREHAKRALDLGSKPAAKILTKLKAVQVAA